MYFSKNRLAYSQDSVKNSRQGTRATALTLRAQYQAAVAELGFQALSGVDLTTLFNDAVSLVARTLNVQYVSVLELLSDGKSLRIRAGNGWYNFLVEQATIDVQTNLEASEVLASNKAIFLEKLTTENRYSISSRLQEYDIATGILAPLPSPDRPLGILEAYSNHPRVFNQDDIYFLQAVANVLSTALERQGSNDLLLAQSHVLELIATGATLQSVLNSMCYLLEQLSPGAYCSILLLDQENNQLRSGAAPSLPTAYAEAFDQLVIGDVSSCGAAAYRGESVYVEDISTNPLWAAFRDFALSYNIRSCWSTPFFSQEGLVLGTFAMSHSFPCRPTSHHLTLIKTATHLASIATQRKQAEKALKQANEELEMRVEERTAQLRQIADYLIVEVAERKMAEIALRQSEAQLKDKAQHLEQTNRQLQQAQSQLIQSEKMSSLGQLVAGVAHEINNPVNFIQGNVTHATQDTQDLLELLELYQNHCPNPTLEIEEKAEEISLEFLKEDLPKLFSSMKVGTNRICEIVQSLRNFSHLDEAEVKAVDIHEGINSTLMILKNCLKARPKYPTIQVVKEYGNLPLVECYAGQLNQVFMNILVNAVDALEQAMELEEEATNNQLCSLALKTPTIWIRTKVVNSAWLRVEIADNGLGIPEEIQHRLFDPFFTTKPVGKGTGMGMSISYQIVTEKHKGQLLCSSEPGKGAEFVVEIPLRQEAN